MTALSNGLKPFNAEFGNRFSELLHKASSHDHVFFSSQNTFISLKFRISILEKKSQMKGRSCYRERCYELNISYETIIFLSIHICS